MFLTSWDLFILCLISRNLAQGRSGVILNMNPIKFLQIILKTIMYTQEINDIDFRDNLSKRQM